MGSRLSLVQPPPVCVRRFSSVIWSMPARVGRRAVIGAEQRAGAEHAVGELDAILLDQPKQRHRGDHLADAGDAKQMLRRRCFIPLAIGNAKGGLMDDRTGIADRKGERRHLELVHEGLRQPAHRRALGRRGRADARRVGRELRQRTVRQQRQRACAGCELHKIPTSEGHGRLLGRPVLSRSPGPRKYQRPRRWRRHNLRMQATRPSRRALPPARSVLWGFSPA